MQRESRSRFADRSIATLAGRQFGVVARRQLLDAGVTAEQIRRRLHGRRLIEVHRGVYFVGHAAHHEHAPKMAALLACGPHATLSHRSAADLWELLPYPASGDVWITVPPGRGAERPRIRIFRTRLDPQDIRRRDGMRVTSPPRALLDIASVTEREQLERAVAQAHYRHLASDAELRAQMERNPNKRGVTALREVLDLPDGPMLTRSPAERRMLRLLRGAAITGFEANGKVGVYEVDFLWRELDFGVEVDGYDAHAGRVAFERDRLKIARLHAMGITILPVTGRRLRREPEAVVRDIRKGLEQVRRTKGGAA